MDFMQRALDLAEGAAGGLAPRPAVGAVIVAPNGKTIVGEGATQPSPGPHAEAVALEKAKESARNGTIYCTLEPHQFHSTTPPCSQAIIEAGISTVVCPTVDPNSQVAGRGFEHLKSAGIKVINDVGEASQRRADELIEGFAKHVNTGMPFLTVKWAMSFDGKIATRDRDSKWITGPASRAHAHSLRYRSDAVMTGIGTILADNPRLTARDPKSGKRLCGRPYIRVVIDSNARMPADAALLEEDGEVIQVVAINSPSRSEGDAWEHNDDAGGVRRQGSNPPSIPPWNIKGEGSVKGLTAGEISEGQRGHCRLQTIGLPNDDGSVDLAAVMQHLGERGCINVLVEAGEQLTGALFDQSLVDKVVAYMSMAKIIGGSDALSPVGGSGASLMREVTRLHNTRIERFDDDIAVIGYVE